MQTCVRRLRSAALAIYERSATHGRKFALKFSLKRNLKHLSPSTVKEFAKEKNAPGYDGITNEVLGAVFQHSPGPVSYTHLDVYKRQLLALCL